MAKSALKIVGAPLSAEREALAEAIADVRAAEARVAKINDANTELSNRRMAAFRAIDIAKAELEEAKLAAPRLVAARIMGETLDGPTVKEAEDTLADAEAAYAAFKSAAEPIEVALREAESKYKYAKYRLEDAVNNVVRSELPFGLAEAAGKCAGAYHALIGVLELLYGAGQLPEREAHFRQLAEAAVQSGHEARDQWRHAIALLTEDASAPLPTI